MIPARRRASLCRRPATTPSRAQPASGLAGAVLAGRPARVAGTPRPRVCRPPIRQPPTGRQPTGRTGARTSSLPLTGEQLTGRQRPGRLTTDRARPGSCHRPARKQMPRTRPGSSPRSARPMNSQDEPGGCRHPHRLQTRQPGRCRSRPLAGTRPTGMPATAALDTAASRTRPLATTGMTGLVSRAAVTRQIRVMAQARGRRAVLVTLRRGTTRTWARGMILLAIRAAVR